MMIGLASKQLFLGDCFFPLLLSAEIVLVEPAENKQVPLVPQNQSGETLRILCKKEYLNEVFAAGAFSGRGDPVCPENR